MAQDIFEQAESLQQQHDNLVKKNEEQTKLISSLTQEIAELQEEIIQQEGLVNPLQIEKAKLQIAKADELKWRSSNEFQPQLEERLRLLREVNELKERVDQMHSQPQHHPSACTYVDFSAFHLKADVIKGNVLKKVAELQQRRGAQDSKSAQLAQETERKKAEIRSFQLEAERHTRELDRLHRKINDLQKQRSSANNAATQTLQQQLMLVKKELEDTEKENATIHAYSEKLRAELRKYPQQHSQGV